MEAPRIAVAMLPIIAVALAIIALTRRVGWPKWRPRNPVWHGAEAIPIQAAYWLSVGVMMQLLAAQTGRAAGEFQLLAILGSAPTPFLIAWGLRRMMHGVPWPLGTERELWRSIRFGAAGFLVVAPPTYLVHFGCLALLEWLGQPPGDHPLAHGPESAAGGWPAYAIVVCLAVPGVEELIHRGIVMPWATRRAANAFLIFAVAAIIGTTVGGNDGFAALALVVGVAAIATGMMIWPTRIPRRTVVGILASAAVFAALHANVWPTPVPLVVLGCGLGWVAARSGGIVAPIVLHGLFNAVAVVSVARG